MKEFATYDVILVYNTDDGITEFKELEGVSKSRAKRKVERLERDRTCNPLDIKMERRG
jgi:hypothetical protein